MSSALTQRASASPTPPLPPPPSKKTEYYDVHHSGLHTFFRIQASRRGALGCDRCVASIEHVLTPPSAAPPAHAPQVPLGPAGVIPPGQHQFPFLVALPHGLPASFSFASGRASGVIRYKIKAVCAQQGLLKPNLRHTQTLHVVPPLAASQPQGRRVVSAACCMACAAELGGEVAV